MIVLTVYADVLIFLNLVVDYLLLCAVGRIIKKTPSVWRNVLGAAVGAVSSLYIFLPEVSTVSEILFKLSVCGLMSLSTFGYGSLKTFLRNMGILFAVTCAYGGIMIAVWYVLKPKDMIINNSVVYFNISPLVLVAASVGAYIFFTVFSRIFASNSKYAEKCTVKVYVNQNSAEFSAIVDTGNSIEDVFGKSEVIIADKDCAKRLFGNLCFENEELKARYRALPCGTVSGAGVLEGYRCDSATVTTQSKTVTLTKPILAISKLPIKDGYSGIINPKTID